jgi:hypothetical protein
MNDKILTKATEISNRYYKTIISNGYSTQSGFIMQCDKADYEMMEDGLNIFLNTPEELGGAGGNDQTMVSVRDKDNISHPLTIQEAQLLALEMKRYFWSAWNKKRMIYEFYINNINELNTISDIKYNEYMSLGFDTGFGYTVECSEEYTSTLQKNIDTMLSTPIISGGAGGGNITFLIKIKDINNNEHEITIQEATQLVMRTNTYRYSLYYRKEAYMKKITLSLDMANKDTIIY